MTDDTKIQAPEIAKPRVAIIMGSRNDWETMQHAADRLEEFGIPFEARVISRIGRRTLFDYSEQAEGRGIEVIIAGAGGAAHLPGMCAAKTAIPVPGVPVESAVLRGVDSLLSIVQMPAGIPVATPAIGKGGAINAGLFAIAILGIKDAALREKLKQWRLKQSQSVLEHQDPRRG